MGEGLGRILLVMSQWKHGRVKPVIGLAGGIGSGKSSVARMFLEEGCGVINSDVDAHEVLQTEEVKGEIRKWLEEEGGFEYGVWEGWERESEGAGEFCVFGCGAGGAVVWDYSSSGGGEEGGVDEVLYGGS